MSPGDEKRRPPQTPLQTKSSPDDLNLTSSLDVVDPLDELAHHLDGTFVVVVRTTGGRYRRRCFISATSAERAAYKANQAGHNAVVYLAQLKPLYRLIGGVR